MRFIFTVFSLYILLLAVDAKIPIVIHTWREMSGAAAEGFRALAEGGSALDAVEQGCNVCEGDMACGSSVGYGGHPDEHGETTLDALIMDGNTMKVGSVASLRRVKKAISVARAVLQYTEHSILAGDLATEFAEKMGFTTEDLSSPSSIAEHESWKNNNCQPNYWRNVHNKDTCGPYEPIDGKVVGVKYAASSQVEEIKMEEFWLNKKPSFDFYNHDTIAFAAIDRNGHVAAGTSTNGANHKIPGRVGDSPIPGAGSYAETGVGACGATGDGDVMLRFSPCFYVVEQMRLGVSPAEASNNAIQRICKYYPNFTGAIFAVNAAGDHAGAGYNWVFTYAYMTEDMETPHSVEVPPVKCNA